jgi:LPXTG-motif cell wall-anchored protein
VTGTGPNNETVTDQDSHLVTVNAAPAIKIDKSGPNAAKVGDTITYTLEVSVPVDTELTDIKVTDTKCDNDPKLKNKLGGDNDDVLEFGEVWVYECTHKATDADIGNLKNVAEVKGTDRTGKKVTDRDDHVVEIEKVLPKPPITPPPPQGPLPFTGFETTDALLLALGLLLAGAGAMWLSRKDANRI